MANANLSIRIDVKVRKKTYLILELCFFFFFDLKNLKKNLYFLEFLV